MVPSNTESTNYEGGLDGDTFTEQFETVLSVGKSSKENSYVVYNAAKLKKG